MVRYLDRVRVHDLPILFNRSVVGARNPSYVGGVFVTSRIPSQPSRGGRDYKPINTRINETHERIADLELTVSTLLEIVVGQRLAVIELQMAMEG